MKKIKIKYFSKDYERLEKIEQGDWIDLRVDRILGHNECKDNDTHWKYCPYKKGDILLIGLGVAMELPRGYEAYVAPRSSLFEKTGLLLTNGIGIIDNSYCGDGDEWKAMLYATRDGEIRRHDKLLQFRIQENQPRLEFEEVKELKNKNRGGYGSTGER